MTPTAYTILCDKGLPVVFVTFLQSQIPGEY